MSFLSNHRVGIGKHLLQPIGLTSQMYVYLVGT